VAAMIVGLLWLGLYPQPVFNTFGPALDNLQRDTQAPTAAFRR
jgi:NADH:ubiquinone oxidoreductase subunit 4 (subunit M)